MPPEELQEQIDALKQDLALFKNHDHFFSGMPLNLKNLRDFGYQSVSITLKDTEGGAPADYDTFFVADYDIEIIAAEESHRTAGTAAGAVTLDIYKLTTGQANADGVTVLSGTFNLKSTAQTPVRVTPTATRLNRILKRGDRLALVDSGTLTAVNHLTVTVYFIPLSKANLQ